jgi:hypothetical protein
MSFKFISPIIPLHNNFIITKNFHNTKIIKGGSSRDENSKPDKNMIADEEKKKKKITVVNRIPQVTLTSTTADSSTPSLSSQSTVSNNSSLLIKAKINENLEEKNIVNNDVNEKNINFVNKNNQKQIIKTTDNNEIISYLKYMELIKPYIYANLLKNQNGRNLYSKNSISNSYFLTHTSSLHFLNILPNNIYLKYPVGSVCNEKFSPRKRYYAKRKYIVRKKNKVQFKFYGRGASLLKNARKMWDFHEQWFVKINKQILDISKEIKRVGTNSRNKLFLKKQLYTLKKTITHNSVYNRLHNRHKRRRKVRRIIRQVNSSCYSYIYFPRVPKMYFFLQRSDLDFYRFLYSYRNYPYPSKLIDRIICKISPLVNFITNEEEMVEEMKKEERAKKKGFFVYLFYRFIRYLKYLYRILKILVSKYRKEIPSGSLIFTDYIYNGAQLGKFAESGQMIRYPASVCSPLPIYNNVIKDMRKANFYINENSLIQVNGSKNFFSGYNIHFNPEKTILITKKLIKDPLLKLMKKIFKNSALQGKKFRLSGKGYSLNNFKLINKTLYIRPIYRYIYLLDFFETTFCNSKTRNMCKLEIDYFTTQKFGIKENYFFTSDDFIENDFLSNKIFADKNIRYFNRNYLSVRLDQNYFPLFGLSRDYIRNDERGLIIFDFYKQGKKNLPFYSYDDKGHIFYKQLKRKKKRHFVYYQHRKDGRSKYLKVLYRKHFYYENSYHFLKLFRKNILSITQNRYFLYNSNFIRGKKCLFSKYNKINYPKFNYYGTVTHLYPYLSSIDFDRKLSYLCPYLDKSQNKIVREKKTYNWNLFYPYYYPNSNNNNFITPQQYWTEQHDWIKKYINRQNNWNKLIKIYLNSQILTANSINRTTNLRSWNFKNWIENSLFENEVSDKYFLNQYLSNSLSEKIVKSKKKEIHLEIESEKYNKTANDLFIDYYRRDRFKNDVRLTITEEQDIKICEEAKKRAYEFDIRFYSTLRGAIVGTAKLGLEIVAAFVSNELSSFKQNVKNKIRAKFDGIKEKVKSLSKLTINDFKEKLKDFSLKDIRKKFESKFKNIKKNTQKLTFKNIKGKFVEKIEQVKQFKKNIEDTIDKVKEFKKKAEGPIRFARVIYNRMLAAEEAVRSEKKDQEKQRADLLKKMTKEERKEYLATKKLVENLTNELKILTQLGRKNKKELFAKEELITRKELIKQLKRLNLLIRKYPKELTIEEKRELLEKERLFKNLRRFNGIKKKKELLEKRKKELLNETKKELLKKENLFKNLREFQKLKRKKELTIEEKRELLEKERLFKNLKRLRKFRKLKTKRELFNEKRKNSLSK